VTGTGSRNSESKPDHLIPVEGTYDLSANLFCHNEQAEGNEFGVSKVPNLFLERHASTHFVELAALSDRDGGGRS
jgi:hypothetical protein